MSDQPARRRGRRDNGLDAAAYVPLADVDPRIGEHLLDVLWAAGVPAYLEPSTDIGPTRALAVPSPPTDRLWVDRSRRGDARTIVEAETPRLPRAGRADAPGAETSGFDSVDDRVWRELVEQFGRETTAEVPPWPVAEDLGTVTRARPEPEPTEVEKEPAVEEPVAPEPAAPPAESAVDEGHFEPPAPPPIPRPSRYALLALAILAAGTLLLVAPGVIGLGGDGAFVLGVVAIVGGVGLLVWRLKEERGDDDDGAVV